MNKSLATSIFLMLFSYFIVIQCKPSEGIVSKNELLNPPTAFVENNNDFAFRVLPDQLVESLMKKHSIHAASLSYIIDWETIVNKSYRLSEEHPLVDSSSIFQAGELSKPLTVLTVMSLIKENRFDLDRDMRADLKEWGVKNDFEGTYLSLRNLLLNRGGFNFTSVDAYSLEEELPNTDQLINGKKPAKNKALYLSNEPIKSYHKFDGSYLLVQKLLETTSREPFESLCDAYVLKSLEMHSSSLLKPKNTAKVIPGYAANNKKLTVHSIYPSSASKGLWSSSYDLAKLLNNLIWAIEGKSYFMDAEAAQDIIGNQIGINYHQSFQSISYYGMTEGYTAHISASLRDKVGLTIMTNSGNAGAFIDELYDYLNRTVPVEE